MEARQQRGLALVQSGKRSRIKRLTGTTWLVPSATNASGGYVVDADKRTCSCPDHEDRNVRCKHLWAVAYFRQEITLPDGATVTVEQRITYRQDWPAYNRAQTEEKDRVQLLLKGLCDGIVQAPHVGRGRKPALLADVVVVRIRRSRNSTPTSLGTALTTTSRPHLVLRGRGTRRLSPQSARSQSHGCPRKALRAHRFGGRRMFRGKASPKGKAAQKAAQKLWWASSKGKAVRKHYLASRKGKAVRKVAQKSYRASPKGKAAQSATALRRRGRPRRGPRGNATSHPRRGRPCGSATLHRRRGRPRRSATLHRGSGGAALGSWDLSESCRF
jgi:hypothetical protein